MLAALIALSMWIVALNLWHGSAHGVEWTGIDGEFPVDQMQYLAWVRDAARHFLVSDLFVLRATPHDYLQPMVAISGGLTAAGIAPWLALLVWKPVAVLAVFFAARAYFASTLTSRAGRRAALVLGLFAAGYGTLGDEWIPFMSWGYPFGLVAVAATLGALVAYERARRQDRWSLLAPALALLAGWLHPWQGELLILVVVGAELLITRRSLANGQRRSIALPATTVIAAALPLVYYAVLQRSDSAWRLAAAITSHHPVRLSGVLLPLAPLLLAAALAYRRAPASFLSAATRVWPLAALAVWAVSKAGLGSGPLHAWAGITIPLAALAVEGVQGLRIRHVPGYRWIAVIAVAALTIPGTVQMMRAARMYTARPTHNQNLITASEEQALRYLAKDSQPGGVLSSYYLGDAIPGETGRRTYSGDYRWSGPGYEYRETMAWEVLHGWIRGRPARAFVLASGARFVLADCRSHVNLRRTLAPTVVSVHRLGCATVYEIG